MKQEEIQRLIDESGQLPTLLNFYAKFREKISDPRISAGEIAQLISSDPSVSGNVLRTANSSFYGLMNRIHTVPHAIVIIGFSGVHFIVLNTAVFNMFKESELANAAFDLGKLWKHSLAVARLSRIIAKKVDYAAYEEMFTAGLLHDIGKVFVFKYFPEEFNRVIFTVNQKNIFMREAESLVLEVDHARIGEMLLRGWNLPETLIATTAYHHDPMLAKQKAKTVSIVHTANTLARALELGSGGDDLVPIVDAQAWLQLGLSECAIDEIVEDLKKESEIPDEIGEL